MMVVESEKKVSSKQKGIKRRDLPATTGSSTLELCDVKIEEQETKQLIVVREREREDRGKVISPVS